MSGDIARGLTTLGFFFSDSRIFIFSNQFLTASLLSKIVWSGNNPKLLTIMLEEGQSALPVNLIDKRKLAKKEAEVLLPRNTIFEVVKTIGDNIWIKINN